MGDEEVEEAERVKERESSSHGRGDSEREDREGVAAVSGDEAQIWEVSGSIGKYSSTYSTPRPRTTYSGDHTSQSEVTTPSIKLFEEDKSEDEFVLIPDSGVQKGKAHQESSSLGSDKFSPGRKKRIIKESQQDKSARLK